MKTKEVKYLGDYKLFVIFENGIKKNINLETFLMSNSNPFVKKYLNKELFSKVYLDECGILCWGDNEMDINPENILNDKYTF